MGDKRLQALKNAAAQGTAAGVLKKYSIICEADLAREFPEPKGS